MKQQRLLLHQILLLLLSSAVLQFRLSTAVPVSLSSQEDGPSDRKLLNPSGGSGGAVSLIMDHPNGTKTYITDGEVPLSAPPPVVGSPASLMAPDRYEFYSFGKDGELVKKLMTLDQIQGLIAGGDELLASAHGSPAYTQGQAPGVSSGGPPTDFYQQPLVQAGEPEGVNKVLESVQNVLKSELQTAHVPDHVDIPPIADDSWSILLPGFLNGELDFKEPIKPTIRPFNVTKLPPVTFPPTTPPSAPPRFTSTPSSTVSNPFQPVKMTTPRRPFPSSQTPFRPPTKATSTKPPIQSTTVKYSAHYTTTPPNAKPKPAAVVKKPTSPQIKPVQPVKPSTRPYNTSSPNLTATESTRNNFTVTAVRPLNSTMLSTTYKPTTAKGTTEKSKPSGIPTITHYLPIQSSINPSDAVKTTKPAVPTKPTTKTTPKPAAKPLKPYSKPQPAATTNQNSRPPTLTTTTTEEPPIAEKLVQRQPPSASLQSATSDMISVSVSTPSGPPSTLKMTAGTTVRPSRPTQPAKPGPSISKTPTVAIQPNKTKTTTSKPLTTQVKKEPVKYKPRPTPSVSVSSVATHKPVLVMNSKPVKQTENVLSAPLVSTTWAPLGSSTKQTTLTTKYTNNFNNKGSYTTSKSPATTTPKLSPTLTTTTKYIAPATMVQSRLPTTIPTTLASTTTPPSTTIQTTTNSEVMSTLSNELAQAPLKIAASLKEPEQNVFEKVPLMPSTIRETTVTTEGTTRWEQISNATGGSSKATATEVASTLPGSTMETTDLPTTLNRVFIINNSEPQTMRTPLRPTDRQPTTETQTQTTSFGRMTTARAEPSPTTVEVPTVISTTSADTQSTVTEPPSMTTFKDQVLEAGISAVASILLDEKITGGKSPLPGRLTTPESSPTAEITSTSSIDTTITEGPSFREEGEEKSPATTAKPSESELSTMTTDRASATLALTEIVDSTTSTTTFDALTTSAVPTVTAPATIPSATIVIQTTPSVTAFITNPTIAAATVTTDITTMVTEPPKATKTPNVERTDSTTGRVEPATQSSKPKLPIKESKLNPESDAEVEAQEHNSSTEGTTMVMEQVKLTEKNPIPAGSAAPPPPPPALKTPYQENKIPPPAFKRPAVVEGSSPPAIELHPPPYESMGAEASTAFLAEDVRRFADLCNELAFRLWTAVTSKGQISSRSLVMSPFAAISLLAMVFLGARGATSGQMNEILRLDDMVTFNPHQVLQNVTDSVINSKNHGVSTAAFVRELYSDKSRGKILNFYKERAQQYYGGHVEEVSFSTVGDVIRRRTNLLVKRQTSGKVPEYLKGSSLNLRPPLAAFSANIFQTDCESGSTDGRDGEMYFVVRPSTRQRRLVPVPAVVWRSGFSAGYEPSLDATSVCLGQDSVVSTLLILPGQQGQVAPGDGLARLEQRLIETSYRRGGWSRLLRSLLPRPGLELQVPRFSHRSVLNVTAALARMGLKDLFSFKADLRGLNGGATDLHLSDMVQVNTFSTCGEEVLGARHHIETYPASPLRTGREDPTPPPHPSYVDFGTVDVERRPRYHFNGDDVVDGRPRSGRLPLPSTEPAPRLRFDRPFLYVVRHNPSGIVLHIGRFNPRLLP